MKVKDVIASKFSDGDKGGQDKPPTPADRAMTIKHTADSVEYNLPHAVDHLDELIKMLDRLCEFDRPKATKLAKMVCAKLDPIFKKVEEHKNHG